MAATPKKMRTSKALQAFTQEITDTLIDGKPHRTPGLGTFSTCSRKATPDRAACKMAMFRAGPELREYASGGSPPPVSGPHAKVVRAVVAGMQSESGIDVPLLGLMAIQPVNGKKPKLIFHAAEELNDLLSAS